MNASRDMRPGSQRTAPRVSGSISAPPDQPLSTGRRQTSASGGFQFQVGWLPAGTLRRIGQFFPKSGPGVENIARNVMQAIA